EICALEDVLKPAYVSKVNNEVEVKREELKQHDSVMPVPVPDPREKNEHDPAQAKIVERLARWRELQDSSNELIKNSSISLTKLEGDLVTAKNSLQILTKAHERFIGSV